jgi:cyclopropane fatty-acyl-phospholipid synthase-like methyltransferase
MNQAVETQTAAEIKSKVRRYYLATTEDYLKYYETGWHQHMHYGFDRDLPRGGNPTENLVRYLAQCAALKAGDTVLDAGCGVGGSSIFLAKYFGCDVTGITLSERQVRTASRFASQNGVAHLARFEQMDYTRMGFPDHHFDVVWAIESMQTATDKSLFFKEMQRVLKPGGHLLIADVFKEGNWKIAETPVMQTMLHGWAMSDLLNVAELTKLAESHNFGRPNVVDVTPQVRKSIQKYRWFALAGMVGTKWYNLFNNATHFSKIHYKTGFAQYRAWKQGLWSYRLVEIEKLGSGIF